MEAAGQEAFDPSEEGTAHTEALELEKQASVSDFVEDFGDVQSDSSDLPFGLECVSKPLGEVGEEVERRVLGTKAKLVGVEERGKEQ